MAPLVEDCYEKEHMEEAVVNHIDSEIGKIKDEIYGNWFRKGYSDYKEGILEGVVPCCEEYTVVSHTIVNGGVKGGERSLVDYLLLRVGNGSTAEIKRVLGVEKDMIPILLILEKKYDVYREEYRGKVDGIVRLAEEHRCRLVIINDIVYIPVDVCFHEYQTPYKELLLLKKKQDEIEKKNCSVMTG